MSLLEIQKAPFDKIKIHKLQLPIQQKTLQEAKSNRKGDSQAREDLSSPIVKLSMPFIGINYDNNKKKRREGNQAYTLWKEQEQRWKKFSSSAIKREDTQRRNF